MPADCRWCSPVEAIEVDPRAGGQVADELRVVRNTSSWTNGTAPAALGPVLARSVSVSREAKYWPCGGRTRGSPRRGGRRASNAVVAGEDAAEVALSSTRYERVRARTSRSTSCQRPRLSRNSKSTSAEGGGVGQQLLDDL